MRIISGKFKGRRFNPPAKIPARPTTDAAKEALFNIIQNYFDVEEVSFLDLFAGTGNLSYEMFSRGCLDIVLVEKDGKSIDFIKKTSSEFEMKIQVVKMDVFGFIPLANRRFKIIFADPPYQLETIADIPNVIFQYQLLEKDGWFILEHHQSQKFDQHPRFKMKRNYGTTIFSIFE